MIPIELLEKWEAQQEKAELLFLADHGGGWPDCLTKFVNTPEDRLRILRQMGFRVAEKYDMPSSEDWDVLEPWARLTNDVAVHLVSGYVIRTATR